MPKSINVKEGIFCIKYLDDGNVAVIDQRSTLRMINPLTLKIVDGFKAKLVHEHRILNIVDVSMSGKYTLIGIPQKNKAAFFINENKKLKATIGIHTKGEIEAVAISDDDHYVATGGTDGRTFIYQADSASPFIALPPKKDYITTINFSDDSKLVAYGSFDCTITVKNIGMMSDDFVLIGHSAPVKKLLFISKQLLVSADRDGGLIVWDLHARKIKVRLRKMLEEILAIALSEDKHFLFVSTVQGNIGVYDTQKLECITNRYLKIEGRVNAIGLAHKEKLLLYGTQEGEFGAHSLVQGEDELESYLEKKDFKAAYAMVNENIMLRFSDYYKQLDEAWDTALSQSKQLFGKGLNDAAVQVLNPFKDILGKRAIIQDVIKEFAEFSKFKMYIRGQKYALAYSLVANHPLFEKTPEYEELEAIWERQFLKAKKSILAKTDEEEARKHLVLFRGISHKSKLITALFNQGKVYTLFKHKLSQEDYKSIFQLVGNHPFLAELKEFKDLKSWSDLIYIKIHEAYIVQDYITAIKLAQSIKDFPDFKEEIHDLVEHSQVYLSFKQAIEAKDLGRVYELLEHNSFLADLPAIKGIDKKWDHILEHVNTFVQRGDVERVLALVSPYKYKKYKMQHILIFIKSAYMKQLETAIENKEPIEKIVKGCRHIYTLFGKDELFMVVVKHYERMHNTQIDFSDIRSGHIHTFDLKKVKKDIFE